MKMEEHGSISREPNKWVSKYRHWMLKWWQRQIIWKFDAYIRSTFTLHTVTHTFVFPSVWPVFRRSFCSAAHCLSTPVIYYPWNTLFFFLFFCWLFCLLRSQHLNELFFCFKTLCFRSRFPICFLFLPWFHSQMSVHFVQIIFFHFHSLFISFASPSGCFKSFWFYL